MEGKPQSYTSSEEFIDEHPIIDNPQHPVARRVADVLRNRSPKPKVILIDDIENIQQAVRSGIRMDSLYVTDGISSTILSEVLTAAGQSTVHVFSRKVAESLFGKEKQTRVFALAKAPRQAQLSDLSAINGDIVVLDGVRLVGNIGAIARTSMGFGAAGIVLLDSGLNNIFDRRLVRASRGLVFILPIVLTTVDEFIQYARKEEIVIGTLAAGSTDSSTILGTVPERMALVLGSERHGVSEEIDKIAHYRCSIAMSPEIESLNVSVSAGIALYERNRPQT